MPTKDFLLLDNPAYLDYFISELKSKYRPVVTDNYLESYLRARGVDAIFILDYLSDQEIYALTQEASYLVDLIINKLDLRNKKAYAKIFKREDVKFFYSTMNYLFKRFVIASMRITVSLEAINRREGIASLSYLHSGKAIDLCGNLQGNSFIFPDDASWRLLQSWSCVGKPPLVLLVPDNSSCLTSASGRGRSFLQAAKALLRKGKSLVKNIKKGSSVYKPGKKNLLFLLPLYDFAFVTGSKKIQDNYNLIIWEIDKKKEPEFPVGYPGSSFFKDVSAYIGDEKIKGYLSGFDLDSDIFDLGNNAHIDMKRYIGPLVRSFLSEKLSQIISCWNTAERLHSACRIDAFFWGNPPHRFPIGIAKEFFRINKVPIFGMQHGGVYGTNYLGSAIFDLDFNHCDYYFSYGFNNGGILKSYPSAESLPVIIPVGSVQISDFVKRRSLPGRLREKVKLIYPITVSLENIFFEPEFTLPHLSSLQREVIDTLAHSPLKNSQIILKFPCATYKKHHLRPYIEKNYRGRFRIIDNISYLRSLDIFEPEIIIIEQQSTPLNESMCTHSSIVVYNDKTFISLSEEAFASLDKRAVVCNTKNEFLEAIKRSSSGETIPRDTENREFFENYCIYNGNPQVDIISAIQEKI